VTEVEIKRGQIWRRLKTGVLMEILHVQNMGSRHRPYYDLQWRTVEKPYRYGQSFEDYWVKSCELVEDVES
jgi:hypothetical protein